MLAGNLPRAALAAGQAFQTIPENHFNCAVGAYTQNIALSPEREKETKHDEEEMYVVLRGGDLASVAEALRVISGANLALGDYALGAARAVAAFRV